MRLKSTYNETVEHAVKPIRERYVSDLKRLLDDYTKAGKLDQALAIKQEIGSMERSGGDSTETAEQFQHRLENTSWLWNDDPKGKFTFLPDGATKGWGGRFKWTVTKPFVVETDKGTIEFDHALLKGVSRREAGKPDLQLKRVRD